MISTKYLLLIWSVCFLLYFKTVAGRSKSYKPNFNLNRKNMKKGEWRKSKPVTPKPSRVVLKTYNNGRYKKGETKRPNPPVKERQTEQSYNYDKIKPIKPTDRTTNQQLYSIREKNQYRSPAIDQSQDIRKQYQEYDEQQYPIPESFHPVYGYAHIIRAEDEADFDEFERNSSRENSSVSHTFDPTMKPGLADGLFKIDDVSNTETHSLNGSHENMSSHSFDTQSPIKSNILSPPMQQQQNQQFNTELRRAYDPEFFAGKINYDSEIDIPDLPEGFLDTIDGNLVFYDEFKEPQGYPIDPTSEIYMDVPINVNKFRPFHPENFQAAQYQQSFDQFQQPPVQPSLNQFGYPAQRGLNENDYLNAYVNNDPEKQYWTEYQETARVAPQSHYQHDILKEYFSKYMQAVEIASNVNLDLPHVNTGRPQLQNDDLLELRRKLDWESKERFGTAMNPTN